MKRNINWQRWLTGAALIIALGLGLAIRLFDLTDPPLDFHVPRQIHSAILARSYAVQLGVPYPQDEVAKIAAQGASEEVIEPPLLEWLTALTYKAAGQEVLWAARVYSALFWVLAALPLFWLARRLAGSLAAWSSLAFYLCLPYGIIASRSFQPDPLMVALTLWYAWLLWRWQERPTWGRLLLAGLAGGAAILVKQVAVFPVAGITTGLLLAGLGWRAALRSRQVWTLAGLLLAPVVAWNIYGLWIAGFLKSEYALRFFPSLWIDPVFYMQWAGLVDKTVTIVAALLAVAGLLLVESKLWRGLLAGWLVGYILYALTFAYHTSTHDYYQLPLIAWVSVGLAPLAAVVWTALGRLARPRWMVGAGLVLLLLGSLFSLWQVRSTLKNNDYRAEAETWRSLGMLMGRDSSTVVALVDDYGARLAYYAYIYPAYWYTQADLAMRALVGTQMQRLAFDEITAGKKYFVVTHFKELDAQPELKAILQRLPIVQQGTGYVVYDIGKR